MKNNKPETLPATDDQSLRELNQKKVVDGIHNLGEGVKQVGDYIKETKKVQKITLYVGIAFTGIIVILVVIGLTTGLWTTGIKNFSDNSGYNRYFICANGNVTDKITTYADAKIFIEQFNGTCKLKHYKVMKYND